MESMQFEYRIKKETSSTNINHSSFCIFTFLKVVAKYAIVVTKVSNSSRKTREYFLVEESSSLFSYSSHANTFLAIFVSKDITLVKYLM